MTTAAFRNRSGELFGRQRDVGRLLRRCAHQGLTVVSGRPRMGKSWLLAEVARQLQEADHLVGYAESTAEQPDLLLRAVADAYARWLVDASSTTQAKSLYERHKGNLIGRAGEAVGALFKEVTKLGGVEWKLAGELAAKSFAGLAGLDRDLKSGGVALPRLSYEQARDLTRLLARLSGQGVVLILDAWEKTPSSEQEHGVLDSYLHHLEDWPPGHLLLGLRVESDSEEHVRRLRELVQGSPDAEEHRLSGMTLQDDAELRGLLLYARSVARSAAVEASDEEILGWIAGYPGVLEWWGRRAVRNEVHSTADLASAASDAQVGRYGPELERVLAPLYNEKTDVFEVAVRLALLPEMVNETQWEALREVVLGASGADVVTRLQVRSVLDEREPRFPSYGHSTRHEAAARWVISRYLPSARQQTEALAARLAASIKGLDPVFHPHVFALDALRSAVQKTTASRASAALVEAAGSLLPDRQIDWAIIEEALPLVRRVGDAAYLWSLALYNTLYVRSQEGDRDGREALLAELRDLAHRHPDDAHVREQLAMALFNSLNYRSREGDRDGRDALLAELRDLANRHPEDAPVRELLAKAFFNLLIDRGDDRDRDGQEAFLVEIREFANRHPEDAPVRQSLARALLNKLNYLSYSDRDGREALLAELRDLAHRHPDDAPVREQLAMALYGPLNYLSSEGDHDGHKVLLAEIRNLANRHPEDAPVRQWLAMALVNTLNDRRREGDRDGREALLVEIRELANRHPEDAPVRQSLARALFNTLNDRSQEGDRDGREALLAELRDLAHRHPDHATLREVAKALAGDNGP